MRRASRWDGAAPLFATAMHGHIPLVDQLRDLVAFSRSSAGTWPARFEIVLGHATAPTKARDQVGPLADAGATWWDERQLQSSEDVHRLTPVLERIEQGPPALWSLKTGLLLIYSEPLNDPVGVPLRPGKLWAGVGVLPVEAYEQPHELAADRLGPENLRQFGEVDEPVGIPRRPIRVIAVDDPIHEMMGLAGLVKERCDLIVHAR